VNRLLQNLGVLQTPEHEEGRVCRSNF
jgi:hypothetical protein